MTQYNISLSTLLTAFKSKSAEIEQAVRLDRETLTYVPRAIGDYICPLLPVPPRLSVAAKIALVNLFKSAQILKAEAVAKVKAAAAAKVPIDAELEAKTKANAANSAKVALAMDLIPKLAKRQAARDFFLANLHQLFDDLLTTDQANALRAGLVAVSNQEEPAEQTKALALVLIRLAKIEDARTRRDQALHIGKR